MSKSIELTQSQIKALQSGATMFLFTIDNRILECVGNKMYRVECSGGVSWDCEKTIIKELSPIQKGDKDIFVQEEFWQYENDILYKSNSDSDEEMLLNGDYEPTSSFIWSNASQMTKEQSRYSFSECIAVRVVKIQDIAILDIPKITAREEMLYSMYNQQMKEQNINRTYEDNDYVFLIEFA